MPDRGAARCPSMYDMRELLVPADPQTGDRAGELVQLDNEDAAIEAETYRAQHLERQASIQGMQDVRRVRNMVRAAGPGNATARTEVSQVHELLYGDGEGLTGGPVDVLETTRSMRSIRHVASSSGFRQETGSSHDGSSTTSSGDETGSDPGGETDYFVVADDGHNALDWDDSADPNQAPTLASPTAVGEQSEGSAAPSLEPVTGAVAVAEDSDSDDWDGDLSGIPDLRSRVPPPSPSSSAHSRPVSAGSKSALRRPRSATHDRPRSAHSIRFADRDEYFGDDHANDERPRGSSRKRPSSAGATRSHTRRPPPSGLQQGDVGQRSSRRPPPAARRKRPASAGSTRARPSSAGSAHGSSVSRSPLPRLDEHGSPPLPTRTAPDTPPTPQAIEAARLMRSAVRRRPASAAAGRRRRVVTIRRGAAAVASKGRSARHSRPASAGPRTHAARHTVARSMRTRESERQRRLSKREGAAVRAPPPESLPPPDLRVRQEPDRVALEQRLLAVAGTTEEAGWLGTGLHQANHVHGSQGPRLVGRVSPVIDVQPSAAKSTVVRGEGGLGVDGLPHAAVDVPTNAWSVPPGVARGDAHSDLGVAPAASTNNVEASRHAPHASASIVDAVEQVAQDDVPSAQRRVPQVVRTSATPLLHMWNRRPLPDAHDEMTTPNAGVPARRNVAAAATPTAASNPRDAAATIAVGALAELSLKAAKGRPVLAPLPSPCQPSSYLRYSRTIRRPPPGPPPK